MSTKKNPISEREGAAKKKLEKIVNPKKYKSINLKNSKYFILKELVRITINIKRFHERKTNNRTIQ